MTSNISIAIHNDTQLVSLQTPVTLEANQCHKNKYTILPTCKGQIMQVTPSSPVPIVPRTTAAFSLWTVIKSLCLCSKVSVSVTCTGHCVGVILR